ncbi:MAG TPA: hypothetical protein VFI90_10055 [Rubrobacter sp.]|nr:hypothetical protein [Rubrobacter sp.]
MVGIFLQLDETTTDGGVDKVATTTKTYFEDLGRIAESNAKSAQESARIATDYWVASRERNLKLAKEISKSVTEGMRRQTDANEELTSTIFEILEERDQAHKRFFGQWAEAFTSMPFDYVRQATQEVEKSVDRGISTATAATTASVNGGFPIAGYDELSVEEISGRLDGLTETQIKQVRDHERRTKNRKSLMEQFERKLNKVVS